MPEFLYVLVNHPGLIMIPIVTFALLALWSHSRSAWVAAAVWTAYLGYEVGMNTGVLCSADACEKRTLLYFGYPLLALLSVVALVQVYVHIRKRRQAARMR